MKQSIGIYEFGRKLIKTKDLDPVYVILQEANMEPARLRRWLLAYWCFYHCGTASWIAEDKRSFWGRMKTAAGSKKYPRCTERRHFRGQLAEKSVSWLRERGVEALFQPLEVDQGLDSLMKYVNGWYGFGDWIAFKIGDMVERLDLACIEFSLSSMFLFDSPREGARLMLERYGSRNGLNRIEPLDTGVWAVERLLERLGERLAPPRYERRINAQEAETILCKWKSHLNGHYRLGDDLREVERSLYRFDCSNSRRLLRAGGKVGLW